MERGKGRDWSRELNCIVSFVNLAVFLLLAGRRQHRLVTPLPDYKKLDHKKLANLTGGKNMFLFEENDAQIRKIGQY